LATFGVGVVGVFVLKYPVSVKAEAQVRPQGELKIVQSSLEGRVGKILVTENQVVEKNQVLAVLEQHNLQSEQKQLEERNKRSIQEQDKLQRQILRQNDHITAEKQRINHAIAAAQAELNRLERDIKDKQVSIQTQIKEAEVDLQIAQQELAKAQVNLQVAKTDIVSAQYAKEVAEAKQERFQKAFAEGAISQDSLQEIQLTVKQQEQSLMALRSSLEFKKQEIQQKKQGIEAAQSRLKRAEIFLNPSLGESQAQRQKIAEIQASGQANLASLNRERENLNQQLIQLQQQRDSNKKELQRLEILLKKSEIVAPTAGVVFKLNLRNTQQIVQSGTEVAVITPQNSPLIIKAQVKAADISKVKTEQKVLVKISACPFPDYGTLAGKVTQVSSDVNLQVTDSQGFYQVTIESPRLYLAQGNKKCELKIGMEGQAEIISRDETILTFLLRKARLMTDL
jgi:multidrug efflux pump subunit AcrA (membrane-fusion protein)